MTGDSPTENCPTCGAEAERGQLICLECGSRIALDYRRAPSWKLPLAITLAVGFVLLIVAVAGWRAVNDNADKDVADTPIQVKEPAKKKAATKKAAAKKKSSPITKANGFYSWPKGVTGYTVVVQSAPDEATAQDQARTANAGPDKFGVIRTADFPSLEDKGEFVVFAGQYPSQAAAQKDVARLAAQYEGASAERVAP